MYNLNEKFNFSIKRHLKGLRIMGEGGGGESMLLKTLHEKI